MKLSQVLVAFAFSKHTTYNIIENKEKLQQTIIISHLAYKAASKKVLDTQKPHTQQQPPPPLTSTYFNMFSYYINKNTMLILIINFSSSAKFINFPPGQCVGITERWDMR